ncbi:MAG: flagella basal body P-ring formation protein FlgA [Delftia acidovorans]|jgi:flagella basal body P-ring formation protein FlgA|nr:flagella basal body P-ring formation protein FlgA [Delftia acidovorans]
MQALLPVAALATACCAPAWAVPAQAWLRVELRPQVTVQHSSVRLADIAVLTSSDLGMLRRALAIPLGQAPRPGESAVLESERLGYWLRSRTGLREDQIDWRGPRQTAIVTAAREIAGEQVAAQAQAALAEHLRSMARQKGLVLSRLDIDPVALPLSLEVPVQGHRLQVRPPNATRMGPRMLVWVDVFSGERHVRAIPVRFEVAAFARLPVASHAMPAGSPVQADGMELREIDVTAAMPGLSGLPALPGGGRMDASAGAGADAPVLRRALQAGDVVSADSLLARPAVVRGEWATLVTRQGPLSLESRVEVLQDGQPGQIVRARPANATGALSVRVVGRGQLELQP